MTNYLHCHKILDPEMVKLCIKEQLTNFCFFSKNHGHLQTENVIAPLRVMALTLVSHIFFRSQEEIPADCVFSSVLSYHIRSETTASSKVYSKQKKVSCC